MWAADTQAVVTTSGAVNSSDEVEAKSCRWHASDSDEVKDKGSVCADFGMMMGHIWLIIKWSLLIYTL
ncbi:hypothetical protein SLA2020_247050 [Shorea laevis]